MTIELTWTQFEEQFQETDEKQLQRNPSDELDITCKFDAHISHGWRREIELREGLWLYIDRHQLTDRLILNCPEREADNFYCYFMLSGKGKLFLSSALNYSEILQAAGTYHLDSSGTFSGLIGDYLDIEPCSFIEIEIQPEILHSFAVPLGGEFHNDLKHLIKSSNENGYARDGNTQPKMKTVLQQIFHCPYQGMVKRMYLESKVIELTALVLDHEITIQQGKAKKPVLKPEQLERVHHAKEILLRDLINPPSLGELARQSGLNDLLLRQGFRQAFGTTVFGTLKSYRLELAKQLLTERDLSVREVANRVGYASVSSFSRAFEHQFRIRPKAYQQQCR